MSKSKKSKKNRRNDDYPDQVKPAPKPGHYCTRCGTGLASAAEQDSHNMDQHLYNARNARE